MPHKIAFKPHAEKNVQQAMEWYAEQDTGLENDFPEELTKTVNLISERPESFGRITPTIRSAPLQRFPYYLSFEIQPEQIKVFRVLHNKQDRSTKL
jgi:plasmid stabilization system protein ParE